MKKFIQWILKALIAGIAAIAILSLFCYFYTYDGIHIASETGATDYVWESGQLKATMKEGFSRVHMDSHGFNNVFDYSKKPDILLMGSSHMEAAQVSEKENVGYLLNTLLPEYQTYNIGMSGHTIYRCMDNLENALNTYEPQKYVVMVVDDIDLSVNKMEEVLQQKAAPIPSYDSGLIYYFQKIPALKVIYKQLDAWMSLDESVNHYVSVENNANIPQNIMRKHVLPVGYEECLSDFLGRGAELAREANVKLVIVYQPSQQLNGDGEIMYEYTEESMMMFEALCEVHDIAFCDITEKFDQLFAEKHKMAHGFNNSEVGEGHLNKYGHAAVAEVITIKIQELEAD